METEGNNNNEGNNRSLGEDETEYFTDDLIPKKLKPGKNMDNYIEIKGNLNPVKFMNALAKKQLIRMRIIKQRKVTKN